MRSQHRPSELIGTPLEHEPGIGALTLPDFVREVSQAFDSHEAMCWDDLEGNTQRFTYRQLYENALQVARALMACGISKGSRVGILVSNRPEWLFCLFGASMCGATVVALNTFSSQQELRYQLTTADVSFLFIEARVASRDFIEDILNLCPMLEHSAAMELYVPQFPFLRRVVCVDSGMARGALQEWHNFLAQGKSIDPELITASAQTSKPTEDALIFFSSGSTALPKAIRQTHRAATLQCWRMGNMYDFDSSVRTWNANGFFFSGNFAMSFGTLCRGGCLVMLRYFESDAALSLIQREKVSCIIAWPHQEARFKESPYWDSGDFSAIKWVTYFSAFRDQPTTDIDWQGFDGYGLTETFTFISLISGEDNLQASQGMVLPGNTIRIIDQDTGELLPIGETGEIIVKGPTLTPGYIGIPSEETFDAEGFFHTADAGYINQDGLLFWKGRLSDIIKTGGANVSPAEIDSVISQHSAIQSSHTVGIPHDTLGELVVSCVVVRDGHRMSEEEVKAFAKQFLSGYKVPRKVLFFMEQELPLTGSNKIKMSTLKMTAIEKLSEI